MWREEIGKTRRAEFLGSVVWKRAACKELQSSRLEEREGGLPGNWQPVGPFVQTRTLPLASLIWWKTSCLWGGGGRSRSLSSRRPRPNWGDLSLNAPHINFSCNSHTFTWSSSGTSCWLALKILEIIGAGSTGVIKYLSFDNTNVLVVKVASKSNTKALDCNY